MRAGEGCGERERSGTRRPVQSPVRSKERQRAGEGWSGRVAGES